jgi:hypothetical protein
MEVRHGATVGIAAAGALGAREQTDRPTSAARFPFDLIGHYGKRETTETSRASDAPKAPCKVRAAEAVKRHRVVKRRSLASHLLILRQLDQGESEWISLWFRALH